MERSNRKEKIGIVTSNKMQKSIVVSVERKIKLMKESVRQLRLLERLEKKPGDGVQLKLARRNLNKLNAEIYRLNQ